MPSTTREKRKNYGVRSDCVPLTQPRCALVDSHWMDLKASDRCEHEPERASKRYYRPALHNPFYTILHNHLLHPRRSRERVNTLGKNCRELQPTQVFYFHKPTVHNYCMLVTAFGVWALHQIQAHAAPLKSVSQLKPITPRQPIR